MPSSRSTIDVQTATLSVSRLHPSPSSRARLLSSPRDLPPILPRFAGPALSLSFLQEDLLQADLPRRLSRPPPRFESQAPGPGENGCQHPRLRSQAGALNPLHGTQAAQATELKLCKLKGHRQELDRGFKERLGGEPALTTAGSWPPSIARPLDRESPMGATDQRQGQPHRDSVPRSRWSPLRDQVGVDLARTLPARVPLTLLRTGTRQALVSPPLVLESAHEETAVELHGPLGKDSQVTEVGREL